MKDRQRFPAHLHRPLPSGQEIAQTQTILQRHRLNTVCEEAKCPNRMECYANRTATFLALGKACTRNCGFCSIDFTKNPRPPEADEPERIAKSVREMNLSHAVITMVTRDDLPDQGAGHIAAIIRAIRQENKSITIEVLTSDFSGDLALLDIVLRELPEIYNHNIETVRSLTPRIRHKAQYDTSIKILQHAKESKAAIYVKSGIMLGFGETEDEVKETLQDLAKIGCDIVAIGQYLQANPQKLRVKEFVPIERFESLKKFGLSLNIPHIYSGPFVRSDYNAKFFSSGLLKNEKTRHAQNHDCRDHFELEQRS